MVGIGLGLGVLGIALAAAALGADRPVTRRESITDTIHGVQVQDPYRWLEDQDSPETRAWIDAQNAHTQGVIGALPVRKSITKRLLELRRIDSTGAPIERAGRYFFARKRVEDEQYILYWRKGLRGKDRVLLDPHPMSLDRTTSVGIMDVSDDGQRVACSVRRGGEDEVEVRIIDVETGADLGDGLPRAHVEGFNFTRDPGTYYYTLLKPLVGRRVYRHRAGEQHARDPVVFGEGYGADVMVGGALSENRRWLLLMVYHGWSRTDVFVQDLVKGGPVRPVVQGLDAVFQPDFAGDRMVVLTDYKAPKRRVLEVGPEGASPDTWREIVPEGDDAIESITLCAGRLFAAGLHNVVSRIRVFDLAGKQHGAVELPGLGTASAPTGRWDDPDVFYTYSSFTTPPACFRLNIATGRRVLWSRSKPPFRPEDFETRQAWATSRDGTAIPMFLVHRKGLKMDQARPVLINAYGGFSVSMTPWFSSEAVLLAEQGGVMAVPALRGGGEFGEAWHRAGMQAKKQNVFDDCRAVMEWLSVHSVSRPYRIALSGGSNGGLLVGAALTQFPELFGAGLCEVPLLDMIRYHRFLQGPQWVPEYGSVDVAEEFRTLLAYSPYHNVRTGVDYPAVLFVTGDSDTRVAPLHARKMTAMLQSVVPVATPVLLHYEKQLGHSGGEPLSKQIENRSLALAFLFKRLGITMKSGK